MRLALLLFFNTLIGCGGGTIADIDLPLERSTGKICKLDLRNFTYPLHSELAGMTDGKVALKDGKLTKYDGKDKLDFEYRFGGVTYGDLFGDAEPEAVVLLSLKTGGNYMPTVVYVVDASGKVIWNEYLGDRPDGGLRSMEIKNRDLFIETYKSLDPATPTCCPTHFVRTQYRLDLEGAQVIGKDTFENKDKLAEAFKSDSAVACK
jgi:hypothetical protein